MGTVRVGTSGFCIRQSDYHDVFGVVELAPTRLPRLVAAQRWRSRAPRGFEFVLRAPPQITRVGAFRDTADVRRAWKSTVEIAAALEAPMVILPTPASFRPTDEHVDRLVRFFQWAHRGRLRLAWEPRGEAWTDDLVRTLCVELSLTHVVDPLERRCMRPRPPVFRIRRNGTDATALAEGDLARLHANCTAPLTYCLFSTPTRLDDARAFLAGQPGGSCRASPLDSGP
ncbi:MAG: DUF72 domain-containing protein [Planctomycetes bacterium]|nr:DUF72 domain-containing protein [Planctomycetota bacterium]